MTRKYVNIIGIIETEKKKVWLSLSLGNGRMLQQKASSVLARLWRKRWSHNVKV